MHLKSPKTAVSVEPIKNKKMCLNIQLVSFKIVFALHSLTLESSNSSMLSETGSRRGPSRLRFENPRVTRKRQCQSSCANFVCTTWLKYILRSVLQQNVNFTFDPQQNEQFFWEMISHPVQNHTNEKRFGLLTVHQVL